MLLIIDVQKGFDDPSWGDRNNPGAEANISRLLEAWRTANRPVIHVRHFSRTAASPLHPGRDGSAFKDEAMPWPQEPILSKQVNSAFIGTNLERRLKAYSSGTLVVVGLTTDHCVSTTTRMAANLGFTPYVIDDATAAFGRVGHTGEYFPPELIHAVNLASLHDEFAQVVSTETLLQRLLT